MPDIRLRDEVDLGGWKLSDEFVQDYLEAVGDALPAYAHYGLVPPTALAARALGSLLEQLELPPGAVHSLQEIATIKPVSFGQEITGIASLGQPKRRGGMEFITAGFTLKDGEGRDVLTGKSTVLVVESEPRSVGLVKPEEGIGVPKPTHGRSQEEMAEGLHGLPTLRKTITQEQLDAYARVSGDHNPLHLDAAFAANTQFGGIIAHGMLTLAFVSEMMTSAFDKAWLETGGLRIRFKGAAYLGDSVETNGSVNKEEGGPQRRRLNCSVGVSNWKNVQELVTGSATVVLSQ